MQNIFDNHHLTIIISFIWGFGLALLFKKICTGNGGCVVVKVPRDFIDNKNIIYDNKDKCFKLSKYDSGCVY